MTRHAMLEKASNDLADKLRTKGHAIIRSCRTAKYLTDLSAELDPVFAATPFSEGPFYGQRTKRFGGMLKRSERVQYLARDPVILGAVEQILGPACDRVQLNVAQAIEIHPGELRQFPHRDHDMWPVPKGEQEYLVNVIWPLTPFTADNGATHIYPKSHGVSGMAKAELGSPLIAACKPGYAICFLGSTAHGAGANVTGSVRRGLVIGYSLGWLKPYENPWLAYPPSVARSFPPELAALAGYAQHRPNLGNYEGQCPSVLLGDEAAAHLGAIDALRPDQAAAVADFAAAERQWP
jgi:ectoine hydroxylase-related dioxygenase (phytanoyl-CoA dioxygenase family)